MQRRRRRNSKRKGIAILVVILILLIVGGVSGYKFFSHKHTETVLAKEKAAEEAKKPNPTDIMPGENIIYGADSYAVPANEVIDMMTSPRNPKTDEKEVFLTFDDGPSENSAKLLKILKDEGVHATFFVLGSQLNDNTKNQELLKEEIKEGNAIGNHTYSHDYHKLYPGNSVNVEKFMNEINKTNDMMKNILGSNFDTRVIRMPGGYMSRKYYHDPHLKALNSAFNKAGIISVDWDAETGDAESRHYTIDQMVAKTRAYMKEEDHVVLLMHDTAAKKQTVEALPQIIKLFKDNGYKFKVIKNAPMSYFKDKEVKNTNNANKKIDENNKSK